MLRATRVKLAGNSFPGRDEPGVGSGKRSRGSKGRV